MRLKKSARSAPAPSAAKAQEASRSPARSAFWAAGISALGGFGRSEANEAHQLRRAARPDIAKAIGEKCISPLKSDERIRYAPALNWPGGGMNERPRMATRLTVSLEEQEYRTLNEIALARDAPISWVIRQAIRQFIETNPANRSATPPPSSLPRATVDEAPSKQRNGSRVDLLARLADVGDTRVDVVSPSFSLWVFCRAQGRLGSGR